MAEKCPCQGQFRYAHVTAAEPVGVPDGPRFAGQPQTVLHLLDRVEMAVGVVEGEGLGARGVVQGGAAEHARR